MNFDQLFPDVRENGETRLRQCQLVMLRLLKILDYLCTRHDIEYFLTGGTLLGAIRHQGFIPWDDDLDLGMTRDNYEKFLRYAVPELPNDIFFQTPETDAQFPPFHLVEAKLRDKYSSYAQSALRPWHNGFMLDIFVYDRAFLPHNIFIFLLNRSFYLFSNSRSNNKRAKVLKFISRYSPFPLVYASSFICRPKMIRLGHSYKTKKELSKVIRVKFEDMEAYIPIGWESYLKRMYGNYMQLPPIEKQKGHHSKTPPNPFTPCEHSEILHWKARNLSNTELLR
jgi:lipopolysaccharide cholinephosphotransferase